MRMLCACLAAALALTGCNRKEDQKAPSGKFTATIVPTSDAPVSIEFTAPGICRLDFANDSPRMSSCEAKPGGGYVIDARPTKGLVYVLAPAAGGEMQLTVGNNTVVYKKKEDPPERSPYGAVLSRNFTGSRATGSSRSYR
jgi:hypothetical protein